MLNIVVDLETQFTLQLFCGGCAALFSAAPCSWSMITDESVPDSSVKLGAGLVPTQNTLTT